MRIEEKIANAYQSAAAGLQVPGEIDARLKKTFEQSFRARVGGHGRSPRSMWKVALIGLLATVIVGFTTQYFVKIGDGRFNLELKSVERIPFDAATAETVRAQLSSVKDRLLDGEKALVYSPEIEALQPPEMHKGLIFAEYVSNPFRHTDLVLWEQTLKDGVPGYRLPTSMLNDYSFAWGEEESAFGGFVQETDVAAELQAEVKESQSLAWRKIFRDNDPFPSYTTVYAGPDRTEIRITMQVFGEYAKMVGLANGTQEKVALNGKEAVYGFSDKFLYSDTNRYKSLSWIDTQSEVSVLYTIGSASDLVTKEQLIAIGETMTGS
ncbi:hypothetical protein ACF3MZ_28690 [Paenibacillaceae bacterium WGS1546]|uniref:hypothetical protein n=1 Tax=Cohnella sp. WGS1546 TaxID=3366810 RepID=UPI00372D0F04